MRIFIVCVAVTSMIFGYGSVAAKSAESPGGSTTTFGAAPQKMTVERGKRVLIRPHRKHQGLQLIHISGDSNGQYTAQYSRPVDAGDVDLKGCGTKCPTIHSDGKAIPYFNNGLVLTQCWYQEITPGIKKPFEDIFLGCDWVPAPGYFFGNQDLTVAQHVGSPNQDSPACEGAELIVNDLFVPVTGPSKNNDVSVKDINAIWSGGRNVGWIYFGWDNQQYVQANLGTQPGVSFALSVGFVGVSINTPGAYSDVRWYQPPLPSGAKAVKCFTKGRLVLH